MKAMDENLTRSLPAIETVPVESGSDQVLRMRGTRVTLDTVVEAFTEGATPEEIAQQYPSVPLADVYSVIGYYLRRSPQVQSYLDRRRSESDQVRVANEAQSDPVGIRRRLMARTPPAKP